MEKSAETAEAAAATKTATMKWEINSNHSSANYITFGVVNMNNEHWNGCSACDCGHFGIQSSVSDLEEGK